MRSEERLIQERLLADAELQEFELVNKIGKGLGRVAGSAAKSVGAVAGGVAGLGQAVKQGYKAGKATVGAGGTDPNATAKVPGQTAQAGGTTATPAPSPQQTGGTTATPAPSPQQTGGTTATPAPAPATATPAPTTGTGPKPKSGIATGVDAAEKDKGEYQGLSPAIAKAGQIAKGTASVAKGAGGLLAKGLRGIGQHGNAVQKGREYNPAEPTKTQKDAADAGKSVAQYQQDRLAAWMAQGDTNWKGGEVQPGDIIKSADGRDVVAGIDGKPTTIQPNDTKGIERIKQAAKDQGKQGATTPPTPQPQDTEKGTPPKPAPKPAPKPQDTDGTLSTAKDDAGTNTKDGPSDTAKDIGDKTGVTPPDSVEKPTQPQQDIKKTMKQNPMFIGGQKVTDPKQYAELIARIPAETRAQIDGLSDYDKGRLKKELAA